MWPPAPEPTNGGKVMPNLAMDAEARRLLNLTVLQRLNPAVEDILITAAHVMLYDLNIELNQWSQKDVEGSLFVVKTVFLTRDQKSRIFGVDCNLDAVFLETAQIHAELEHHEAGVNNATTAAAIVLQHAA
ncbi:hypothetical protein E2562_018126 [Oryza meyeriana var. granulata]|uniref:Uncharacterized protein n=1 Tax=Oryza meyeriana var. granulata TaxID=110450 RepID=A0A6G1C7L8_9ORYZ|nr:hypothetical protein E2562_018126 [Oryza meyeriana var. granulata]